MEEFFGEQIEVKNSETSPQPVRFTWRGEAHEVIEVLDERVVRDALWQQAGTDSVTGRKNERDNGRWRREWSSCAFLSILVNANSTYGQPLAEASSL
jgi:hypothetical protein